MTDQHELVDDTQANWDALLDYTQLGEHFADPEAGLRYLQGMSYDQFEDFSTQVNGIIRGIPEESRHIDGVGFVEQTTFAGDTLREFEPPAVEDRRPLMQEAHAALKLISDPAQAATMLGLARNIIHPYNNGNGRMNRFTYIAMTHGYDGSPEDDAYFADVLSSPGGRKIVDLNTKNFGHLGLDGMFNNGKRKNLAHGYGYDGIVPLYSFGGYDAESVEYEGPENMKVNAAVSNEGRLVLDAITHDERFETTVFMEFILKSGRDLPQYIRGGEGAHPLLLDRLFAELTDEDIAEMYSMQSALKREFVRSVIGIFTEEENREFAAKITEFYRPKAYATS